MSIMTSTGKVNKLHYLIIGGIPYFYFNILGHYYPIFLSRYVIFAFVLSLFLWSLFWYILYIIEFYIILVHVLDPNYMKLSPKYPSFIKNGMRSKKRLASSLQKLGY